MAHLTFHRPRRRTPRGTDPTASSPTTHAEVLVALAAIGIPALRPDAIASGSGLRFVGPAARDGAGRRILVDLPFGVTVDQIAVRRPQLASGLRRPLDSVWISRPAGAHPGRLSLWLADTPMRDREPAPWPLAGAETHDVSAPTPLGTDQYGRTAAVTVDRNHLLISGGPRTGVTAVARTLAVSAALDPAAQIWAYDLHGAGDLDDLAPVAERHRAGTEPATVGQIVADLNELRQEVRRRAAHLRTLSDSSYSQVRTGRIAPVDLPGLGVRPIIVCIDEAQELFHHPLAGREAIEAVGNLLRIGRAFGITMLVAASNPDRQPLPAEITDQIPVRFCLRVASQLGNDRVLGTGAYRDGVRATDIDAQSIGRGILVGTGDEPLTVDAFYADTDAIRKAVNRAVQARIRE